MIYDFFEKNEDKTQLGSENSVSDVLSEESKILNENQLSQNNKEKEISALIEKHLDKKRQISAKNKKVAIILAGITSVLVVVSVVGVVLSLTSYNEAPVVLSKHAVYTYSDNPSYGSVEGSGSYEEGELVIVKALPKTNYKFCYWDMNGKTIATPNYSFNMPSYDVTFTAHFEIMKYSLNAVSSDESKGTVSGSGIYEYGQNVTITATPLPNYSFYGWLRNDKVVSFSNTYTFEMPNVDVEVTAKFVAESELDGLEEEKWNVKHGLVPSLSLDGRTITYGLYPQSYVSNAFLISALNGLTNASIVSSGYYFYENEYYYPLTTSSFDGEFLFSGGDSIERETKYWFQCEPIKWDVLENKNGNILSKSSKILDSHMYSEEYIGKKNKTDYKGNTSSVYANNYQYSEIRSWLNKTFYTSAFKLDASYILPTSVDNSRASTCDASNSYTCLDFVDKVFLLSRKEVCTSSFGFDSDLQTNDPTRASKYTDFSITRYLSNYHPGNECAYGGYYWTRSPAYVDSKAVWTVSNYGFANSINHTSNIDGGVLPAITITL